MNYGKTNFHRLMFIAIVVGVAAGFGSLLFFKGLQIATAFFMGTLLGYNYPVESQTAAEIAGWAPPPVIWYILPIICFGALVSGILVFLLAPETEGHGTDAAIRAFHGEGKIRRRVPFVKAVTAILTISTGGSAGREGPTAQIAAGIGCMVAEMLNLSPQERRMALNIGIGAGIGTIFMAPLGGAILAAEILYRKDFETAVIVPAFLASIIGYSIFGLFEGFSPVFAETSIFWSVYQLPFFLLLGLICAAYGWLYVRSFYQTHDVFAMLVTRYHIPPFVKPVTGAFLTGLIVILLSLFVPFGTELGFGSLGSGYGFVQLALYSMLPLAVLIALPFLKILTTSLTIGSGGSGGVFAPGLVIGGMIGGMCGVILNIVFPAFFPVETIPAFIIIGMIALFGCVAFAPISVMIMVVEMTGNFSLLVPAMGAVAVACLVTTGPGIYHAQVETKADSEAHRGKYEISLLEHVPAGTSMTPADRVIVLHPEQKSGQVLNLIRSHGHTGFPVLEEGKLVGIMTIQDVRQVREKKDLNIPVRSGMTSNLLTITPDVTLDRALKIMIEYDINHLPVVKPEDAGTMIGFLTRTDIMTAYARCSKVNNGYTKI